MENDLDIFRKREERKKKKKVKAEPEFVFIPRFMSMKDKEKFMLMPRASILDNDS